MEAVVVPARLDHAFVLATTLRPADVAELEVCGLTPLSGLLQSMRMSDFSYAVLYDDVVGAMFGVGPLPSGAPVLGHSDMLWFLTGHLFGEKPVAFTKVLKAACAALLERYPRLMNAIDARYTGAIRLAEVFGATLGEPFPFGRNGELFVPFTIERKT